MVDEKDTLLIKCDKEDKKVLIDYVMKAKLIMDRIESIRNDLQDMKEKLWEFYEQKYPQLKEYIDCGTVFMDFEVKGDDLDMYISYNPSKDENDIDYSNAAMLICKLMQESE